MPSNYIEIGEGSGSTSAASGLLWRPSSLLTSPYSNLRAHSLSGRLKSGWLRGPAMHRIC